MGDDEMISVFNPPKQMTTDQKIRHIANHYGFESQSRQLMEECGELTQATNKVWRTMKELETDSDAAIDYEIAEKNLIGEIADISIMIAQIQKLLGINDERVMVEVEIKLDREIDRIKKKQEVMTYQ